MSKPHRFLLLLTLVATLGLPRARLARTAPAPSGLPLRHPVRADSGDRIQVNSE